MKHQPPFNRKLEIKYDDSHLIESEWVYLTAKDLFKTNHFKINRLDVSIYDKIQVQQLQNKKLKYKNLQMLD